MIEVPIRSDALDYEDIISRIQSIFDSCTPLEQKQFIKILEELSDKGYSETLDNLYLVDFKEVPVGIDRFLCDPNYLGKSNDNGQSVYPGWWEVYHDVFNDSRQINEVILSGATRIGKTSTAVAMMSYMTYLLMCYKNPQKYFGLKPISRLTIAFANLTKDLAQGVGFHEYQSALKESPWFNEHGRFTNSISNYVYVPEGEKIDIIPASDSAHVLGMQLWCCLVGDTKILTSDGAIYIKDLENRTAAVKQYDFEKSEYVYVNADVVKTKYVSDTIKITLEDGTVFEGTPDHKVMLIDGSYKRLDELTEDDEVLSL